MSALLGRYTQVLRDPKTAGGYTSKEIEVIKTEGSNAFTKCGQTINIYDLMDESIYAPNALLQGKIDLGMGNEFRTGAQGVQTGAKDIRSLAPTQPTNVSISEVPVHQQNAQVWQAPEPIRQAPPVVPVKKYSEGQIFVESAINMSKKQKKTKTVYVEIPLELDFDIDLIGQVANTMQVDGKDLATVVADNIGVDYNKLLKIIATSILGIDAVEEQDDQPEPLIESVQELEETDDTPTLFIGGEFFIDPLTIQITNRDTNITLSSYSQYTIQDLIFDDVLTSELLDDVASRLECDVKELVIVYPDEPNLENLHKPTLLSALGISETPQEPQQSEDDLNWPTDAVTSPEQDDIGDIEEEWPELTPTPESIPHPTVEGVDAQIEQAKTKTQNLPKARTEGTLGKIWRMQNQNK